MSLVALKWWYVVCFSTKALGDYILLKIDKWKMNRDKQNVREHDGLMFKL